MCVEAGEWRAEWMTTQMPRQANTGGRLTFLSQSIAGTSPIEAVRKRVSARGDLKESDAKLELSQNDREPERPNMIVILADDMGIGDIGAYRSMYPGVDDRPRAYQHTSHLDRLAEEGIRFTRAYATSWCAPSRQLLLSGQRYFELLKL